MQPISLPAAVREPSPLPFRGENPAGEILEVNSRYITYNGVPWFPVSGEFHFSRYRREDWERELCKMKAGGVSIIATYIFWIHHEEEEGVWNFSGQRDLRHFVELCQRLGLLVLLRIGPWCHGECRNGGFPDWIRFQNRFPTRTDHPEYLRYVRRWFTKIAREAEGLFWKDGGPVIGVQLENEYRAYAEPDREKRKAHMHTLRQLAEECGFVVPIYTATAWGTATLNEMETLPVLGGYADAAWEKTLKELPENAHFLFQPPMNDPSIGSDLKADDGNFSFDVDINRYPYLTAELGGGMQVTLRRRVVIDPKDTEAIAVCMMGSGSSLLGYYMYHGGTNPDGKRSTLEESAAVGAPNTLPVRSYDFQAILRENGEAHESYHLLRRHHLLLHEFGWLLAPSETVIPKDSATDPADLHTLRYAVRHHAGCDGGFIFVSNHLRKRTLDAHPALSFTLQTAHGTVVTPPVDVRDHDILILPYRIPLGKDCILISSNATPLCSLGERWFFYTDAAPIYRFAGRKADIVTLTERQSRCAYRLGDRVYIADCVLYEKDGDVLAEYSKDTEVLIYGERGEPEKRLLCVPRETGSCTVTKEEPGVYRIALQYPASDAEPMLAVEYTGDRVEIYDAKDPGHLIADWFTTGLPLRLSLNALGRPDELLIRVFPSESERYFDLPVPNGQTLREARMFLRCITRVQDARPVQDTGARSSGGV